MAVQFKRAGKYASILQMLPLTFLLVSKGLGPPLHLLFSTCLYTLCCGHTKLLALLNWAKPVQDIQPLELQRLLSAFSTFPHSSLPAC